MSNVKRQIPVALSLLRKSKAHAVNNIRRSQSDERFKLFGVFKNVCGAIDVASIMVGVIVIGIVGALIAAATFVVVPWAQDEAAKNQLKSLMNAQQAYAGMKATGDVGGQQLGSLATLKYMQANVTEIADNESYAYGDLSDLIEADFFDPAFLPSDASDEIYGEQMLAPNKSMCVIKLAAGEGYEAAVLSASGNVFVTNDGWFGPVKVPETSPVCFGRVLGVYEDSEDTVIIPPVVVPIEEMNPAPPVYVEEPEETAPSETPGDGSVGGVNESAEPTPEASEEPAPEGTEETDEPDEIIEPTPSETPSETPTSPTPAPSSTPASSASPSPSKPPVTPETAPEPPAANKDPKTKKFMFCHHGAMHSNAFNGMVNGHHGHEEDIMPPIPFKNYVGWNWNDETAKIYYNNCKPL